MAERRLLVIDDQPEMGELLTRVAEPLGYIVTVTRNPEHARTLFGSVKPDIVMLDILMPQKDGIEIMTELAKDIDADAAMPLLILMSGSGDVYLSSAGKIAEGYGWSNIMLLTKPISIAQLRDIFMHKSDTDEKLAVG